MFTPVIMAGGSGTRLWPLSRTLYPKQYLSFGGDLTMLQQALKRLEGLDCARPLIVCNEKQRFLAALHEVRDGRDPVLMVLAADHYISDVEAFHASVHKARGLAENDKLVTFGIVPQSPETGYGYIQRGVELGDGGYQVAGFVEKPDIRTARSYLESGDYFWNSGMFMFRAGRYLEELERFQPEMLEVCREAMDRAVWEMDFVRVDRGSFLACPADSIDYAVMEKTKDAAIVPMDAGWCDVGSWSALWEISPRDENGNVCKGDVIAKDTRNSLTLAESRLVATLGVEDLVVIETKDAVLVSTREKAQNIKSIVEEIKKSGRTEYMSHREVSRPWGSYDSIDVGERYQVKRITVKPGAKLSVQMHHHRAEHWIVVSGTARVTNGDESFLVTENQSTYIPVGQVHALEEGGTPLEEGGTPFIFLH